MEELLAELVNQNASILAALESVSDKLDTLGDIKYAIDSIDGELQWHKDLSAVAQIIKAVEDVTVAVSSIDT
jgi:hypothetical protein